MLHLIIIAQHVHVYVGYTGHFACLALKKEHCFYVVNVAKVTGFKCGKFRSLIRGPIELQLPASQHYPPDSYTYG